MSIAVAVTVVLALAAVEQEEGGSEEPQAEPRNAGPAIELAPTEQGDVVVPEAGQVDGFDPLRGLMEQRLAVAASTSIGGYGELHYGYVDPEEGDGEGEIDLHRLVLFVAHKFSDRIRFYTEIEFEHALAGNGKPGEVGVEQAFVDYDLFGEYATLRAGVVLVPMGIINQWHEPPVFNGVERPLVDKTIIPSTWREGGVGVVGKPIAGLAYELYIVGGLNPLGFSASSGLRSGRQAVAEANATAVAVTGRVEYEPVLGVVVGGSAYYGEAGDNLGDLFTASGETINLTVPVLGLAGDVRARWQGIEGRAVVASFTVGSTEQLRELHDANGDPIGVDIGSRTLGAYGELGYDVLHVLGRDEALVPFVRYELVDTMNEVEGRGRTPLDDAHEIHDLVAGLSFRPVPQVVFKGDVIWRDRSGSGDRETLYNLGVGFMY